MKSIMLAASVAVFALAPVQGFAMGDGGAVKIKCREGLTLNPSTKKCEKPASYAPDRSLIDQGAELAYGGSYDAAIAVLWQVDGWMENPRALNYLGFAHRKSGDLETAFSYYKLALQADPNYTLARSYLGEGYLAAGKLDLAENELREIAARAGEATEEYKVLAERIAAFKAA